MSERKYRKLFPTQADVDYELNLNRPKQQNKNKSQEKADKAALKAAREKWFRENRRKGKPVEKYAVGGPVKPAWMRNR